MAAQSDTRDGVTLSCTPVREGDSVVFAYSLANDGRGPVFAADAGTRTDALAGTAEADQGMVTVWLAQDGYAHVLKGVAPLPEDRDVPGRIMPLMVRLEPGARIERRLVLALPLAEQSDYYALGPVRDYRIEDIEGIRLSIDVLTAPPPGLAAEPLAYAEGHVDIGVRGTLPLLRRVSCSFRAKGLHLMVRTDAYPRPD